MTTMMWPIFDETTDEWFELSPHSRRSPADTNAARPTMSVIVGTYGDNKWKSIAQRAVESALNQVIHCEVLHVHGATLAGARNTGAKLATGRTLIFLDADDELAPGYIEAMIIAETNNPSPALLQPATQIIGVDEHPALIPPKPLDQGNFMVIGTAVPAALFHAVGGFRDWPLYEDWCLWIRCTLAGAAHVPVPDAVYQINRDHVGRNLPDRPIQEHYFWAIHDTYYAPIAGS